MKLSTEILALATWIQHKINTEKYGEVQITLKIHAGKPTLLEKAFIEKTQLTGYTGSTYANSR